ncbi:Nicotinate dehydrogenase FAD-subunit [uncultured Clostridium sp.]|uniref:xanthine dehydrogenase FAD-binding subunit XdhB n=1 Tax=uncultured Clostridium sp. TaxID=59620 RepID=UPI00082061E3|nr:xanthine dehydrogenase FAD-binding subunit XdhB [uncultured Clostridium sp.]SCK04358.1 Nicotinate dehydrogenase FAD-subunit [uncultured Clostridium sp.]
MFDIKNIYEPTKIKELLVLMDTCSNPTIIAGGTDVLIKLRHGSLKEVELISIRKIKELNEIKLLEDETISIGSLSSFSTIFRSKIVNDNIPILAEGAVSMGGPQIRNMATIGGNICNGAVSADSIPSLFALNAKLRLVSVNGERIIPITDFYLGPGKVKVEKNEVLTHILIKKEEYLNKKGSYIKFSNRKAMDISMLGVAVVCEFDDNKFTDLRIALGVAGPTPIRCNEAENFAKGKEINSETLDQIGKLAVSASNPRDSWRGSKEFRQHLIANLSKRAIDKLYRN